MPFVAVCAVLKVCPIEFKTISTEFSTTLTLSLLFSPVFVAVLQTFNVVEGLGEVVEGECALMENVSFAFFLPMLASNLDLIANLL